MDNPLYPPMSPGAIAGVLIGTVIGLVVLAAGAMVLWRLIQADRSGRRTREQIDAQLARDAYERGLNMGRREQRPVDDHQFQFGRVVDAINQLGRQFTDQHHQLVRQLGELQTQVSRTLLLGAGNQGRTPVPPRPAPAPQPKAPAAPPTTKS